MNLKSLRWRFWGTSSPRKGFSMDPAKVKAVLGQDLLSSEISSDLSLAAILKRKSPDLQSSEMVPRFSNSGEFDRVCPGDIFGDFETISGDLYTSNVNHLRRFNSPEIE